MGIAEFFVAVLLICGTAALYPAWQQAQDRRHAERMKALQLARKLPDGKQGATLACLAIGGVVPVVAQSVSIVLAARRPPGAVTVPLMALSLILGLSGIIGGTILAQRLLLLAEEGPTPNPKEEKPSFDPDAYDLEPADRARR